MTKVKVGAKLYAVHVPFFTKTPVVTFEHVVVGVTTDGTGMVLNRESSGIIPQRLIGVTYFDSPTAALIAERNNALSIIAEHEKKIAYFRNDIERLEAVTAQCDECGVDFPQIEMIRGCCVHCANTIGWMNATELM